MKNTKADFAYASANTDELAELWNASVRAKAVYGDVMAGQEELDAAKAELESAQNVYLKKVTGCKETLTEEIKVSEKIDLSKYTSESAAKYQEALKRAKEMLDRADAQPEELDAAKKELEEARKALTEKAEQQKPDPTPTPTPNPNPAPDTVKTVPKKGTVFTDGKGISYKVTKSDAKKGTVAVTGTRKKRNKITIPATVTKDGYTFKVTEIAAKAFQNNKKLTTLILGTNIRKIGTKSFYKNSKLKSITFKNKNAVKIGSQAFKGIKATAKVTVPKKMTAKNFGR